MAKNNPTHYPHFPPYKPGNPGGPGTKSAGASIVAHFNNLSESTYDDLVRIADDGRVPATKRAAAIQWLKILRANTDIADFADFIEGAVTLKQLRDSGVQTGALASATVRTGKVAERSVQLDRDGGRELDRIMDRTLGKPTQKMEIDINATVALIPRVSIYPNNPIAGGDAIFQPPGLPPGVKALPDNTCGNEFDPDDERALVEEESDD